MKSSLRRKAATSNRLATCWYPAYVCNAGLYKHGPGFFCPEVSGKVIK